MPSKSFMCVQLCLYYFQNDKRSFECRVHALIEIQPFYKQINGKSPRRKLTHPVENDRRPISLIDYIRTNLLLFLLLMLLLSFDRLRIGHWNREACANAGFGHLLYNSDPVLIRFSIDWTHIQKRLANQHKKRTIKR